MKRTFTWTMVMAMLLPVALLPGRANEVVEIRLRGHYYSEPATVRINVAVEPDAQNRKLRVEADGEHYYRSSDVTLSGASEKKVHTLEFRSLPAGAYVLRAEVYSSSELRGVAQQELHVTGVGADQPVGPGR